MILENSPTFCGKGHMSGAIASTLRSCLNSADLKTLKEKFPDDTMGVKVQSLNKARDRAMLICYLQHTDVMDRLELVDPSWTSESLEVRGGTESTFVRMKLTLKDVSRENVGEGNDPKAAFSDALKRCAMMFGVGRYLYDSEGVWVPYSETNDKFKIWTMEEYKAALAPKTKGPAHASPIIVPPAQPAPVARPAVTSAPRPGVPDRLVPPLSQKPSTGLRPRAAAEPSLLDFSDNSFGEI